MAGAETVFSVSNLNEYVCRLLENDIRLRSLKVSGELTGFKRHSSGHLYFSLKDENALIRCVMFRSNALKLSFEPKDGMQVVLSGSVSLYVKDGQYQFYATGMRPSGEGELYKQFLELRDKLSAEGLFDRKRPIPFLPRCVGVATSETGAAFHDIRSVISRRFPTMRILLAPVQVQGMGAAQTIIDGISLLNEVDEVDVIIVGRGGGSYEDLSCFNDEALAMAVFMSKKPVISAVGHEIDFTICDFVSDLRAPTP
ncbi:MAG: exodeoxyribonuclease VII large subunit, partial [Clostridia bacterium]|nr:exodeoxyribonuclease VII large subunit [Clostridia bacterium]